LTAITLVITNREKQTVAPIVNVPKRFDIEFSPHLRYDTFLIDQQEGKVYISGESKDKTSVWLETPLVK
jgi:hypothetical protein